MTQVTTHEIPAALPLAVLRVLSKHVVPSMTSLLDTCSEQAALTSLRSHATTDNACP